MVINDILIPIKYVVNYNDSANKVISEFCSRNMLEAPVMNGKDIIGILALEDLYEYIQGEMDPKTLISGIRISEKTIVNVSDSISEIEKLKFNKAIVIDENHEALGIIRKQDIMLLKLYELNYKDNNTSYKLESLKESLLMSDFGVEIMDFMTDGIYITDGKGVTIYVNKAYTNVSGLNKEDLIGRDMIDLIKAGYFEDSASLKVIKTKEPVSIIDKYRNGNTCLATSSPVLDNQGKIIYIVTNIRDMTELYYLKKRVEEANKINREYRAQLDKFQNSEFESNRIIGTSKQIKDILEMITYIANVDTTVLIQGETGVGKEVFAKEIHLRSDRKNDPFIKVNCSAIPDSLFESQLFGYEKGAFTGAVNSGRQGIFETASGGTLLLDEISEIPLNIQPKLLRVLQEKQIMRVGSSKSIDVDVKIIAATNKNLWDEVKEGRFREDLYYRLNIIPIKIPPLRDRVEDIKHLSHYFLEVYNGKYSKSKTLTVGAIELLESMEFKGNVRQLKNLIERIVLVCMKETISDEDILTHISSSEFDKNKSIIRNLDDELNLNQAMNILEEHLVSNALQKHKTTRKAALALGISQPSIVRKAQKYNIKI